MRLATLLEPVPSTDLPGRQVIYSDFPKIFSFRFDPNHFYIFPVHPTEGRIAIVTDAGLDAVDARALGTQLQSQGEMNLVSEMRRARRRRFSRTVKPCGPGTRCWCQVSG